MMTPLGPSAVLNVDSTVNTAQPLAGKLQSSGCAQNLTGLPVTRCDGVLLLLVRRDDAERALAPRQPQPSEQGTPRRARPEPHRPRRHYEASQFPLGQHHE